MDKEFVAGCIHMLMDTCGIREYTIEDGADRLLRCRFVATANVDMKYMVEKMTALKDVVSFVTDWRL